MATIKTCLSIGDVVWLMKDNKVVEGFVSVIEAKVTLLNKNEPETMFTKTSYDITDSKGNLLRKMEDVKGFIFHRTKEDLLKSL